MDVATILQFMGDRKNGIAMQAQALRICRTFLLPAKIIPARLRVLALMAPGAINANVPLECLLEESDADLYLHYVRLGQPLPASIPEHDVLFVAIAESQANRPYLEQMSLELVNWPRPVLNLPENVVRVARDKVGSLLEGIPGIVMPPTMRIERDTLMGMASSGTSIHELLVGMNFPFIIRPIDSHAGRDLSKVNDGKALRSFLESVTDNSFFISPYIDYCDADGMFRKYRIAIVGGQPFACHMAISSHWMVHYVNAGMANCSKKRAEEARFLATFGDDFSRRYGHSLRAIDKSVGLDYVCIDCAETTDGQLLIFEIDPAMIVHACDSPNIFPYKQLHMHNIFHSFSAMLAERAVCH
jgi:glutathione synthase/RimK-type ligase-like ATP-grasp enzyme